MAETTDVPTPLHPLIRRCTVPGIDDYLDDLDNVLYEISAHLDDLEEKFAGMDFKYEKLMPGCLRKNIISRFKVDLLPPLRNRMALLDLTLNRSSLSNSNIISALQIALEHMTQVDEILNEMVRCITPIVDILRTRYKPPPPPRYHTNSRHIDKLESLGDVLWCVLRESLTDIISPIHDEFNSYHWLLEINTGANSFNFDNRSKPAYKSSLSAHLINVCIQEFSRSDFQVYKLERWRRMVRAQSGHLKAVSKLLSQEESRQPLNLPLIESLHASVPITKLIRLFVNKLCKRTNNQPHPVSQMNGDKLAAFYDVTRFLETDAAHFSAELVNQDLDRSASKAAELTDTFKDALVILNEFFSSPFYMHRLEFQNALNWYITWAAQFDAAVKQYLAR